MAYPRRIDNELAPLATEDQLIQELQQKGFLLDQIEQSAQSTTSILGTAEARSQQHSLSTNVRILAWCLLCCVAVIADLGNFVC